MMLATDKGSGVLGTFRCTRPSGVGGKWPVRTIMELPEGRYRYELHEPCPFTLRAVETMDGSKSELRTWWRPVQTWPDGSVRSAEIGGTQPKIQVTPTFEVVDQPSARGGQLPQLSKPVLGALVPWGGIRLGVTDARGLDYLGDLTVSSKGDGYPDRARLLHTSEDHAKMELDTVLAPSALRPDHLPHCGGLHAVLTAHRGLECIELVLTWHNAVADERHAPISTLGDIAFRSVALHLPRGWRAKSVSPMPEELEVQDYSSHTSLWLISPVEVEGEPRAHRLPQQKTKTWRLVLHREGDEVAAKQLARKAGRGKVTAGPFAIDSPLTLGPWAVGLPAPRADVDLKMSCSNQILEQLSSLELALAQSRGLDHRYRGPLGPFRPWREAYGGGTGGEETGTAAGIEAALAGGGESIVWHSICAEMSLDRIGGFLFDLNGDPDPCDASVDGGTGANFELTPVGQRNGPNPLWLSGKDPLGFLNPPQQNQTVGVIPDAWYVEDLLRFGTHDHQHLRRSTYHLEALLVLEGDSTAAWLLEGQAASVIASWNDEGAKEYGSTLGYLVETVKEEPHVCTEYGRDLAHNLYTVALAANVLPAGHRRRERYHRWIQGALEVEVGSQASNGLTYAASEGKAATDIQNRADATQFYEIAMLCTAVRAGRLTLFGGFGTEGDEEPIEWRGAQETRGKVKAALRRCAIDQSLAICKWWRPGDVGPYFNAGTQPFQNSDPAAVWDGPEEQPEEIVVDHADDFYPPVGLAVGLAELVLEEDGEAEALILEHVRQFTRGEEPREWLADERTRNLPTWGLLKGVLDARAALGLATDAMEKANV